MAMEWQSLKSVISPEKIFPPYDRGEWYEEDFKKATKNYANFLSCGAYDQIGDVPGDKDFCFGKLLNKECRTAFGGCERDWYAEHRIGLDHVLLFRNKASRETVLVAHPYHYDWKELVNWCKENQVSCRVYNKECNFYGHHAYLLCAGSKKILDKKLQYIDESCLVDSFDFE